MLNEEFKKRVLQYLERWWATILILPFIIYSVHQVYWALSYNIFFAVNYSYPFPLDIVYLFTDTFLLIVHEAGHTFFSFLGSRFLTILGGSLFQILLPLAIVGFCWINRKYKGLQFSLVLTGLSWLDVATYAADGGARQIPLIGNLGKEAHDWHNLLVRMNALEHDITFGIIFVIIGMLFYLIAVAIPLFYKKYERVDIKLSLD